MVHIRIDQVASLSNVLQSSFSVSKMFELLKIYDTSYIHARSSGNCRVTGYVAGRSNTVSAGYTVDSGLYCQSCEKSTV